MAGAMYRRMAEVHWVLALVLAGFMLDPEPDEVGPVAIPAHHPRLFKNLAQW
jgi:hypothetical protein